MKLMMMKIKNLSKYKYFLIPFLLWILLGVFVLFRIDKGDLVLYFNNNRTPFGNVFFTLGSKLAEWQFILFVVAILAYKKFGNAFILLIGWATTGVIAQSLKRVFDLPRPAGYFTDIVLNFIDSSSIHYHNSFPSGHTTTAFTIFFILTMITDKKYLHFIYFLLALSTAFSRVYLLQHFFIDVYFGSILGLIIGYFVFVSINKSNIFGFQKWKNKRLGNRR